MKTFQSFAKTKKEQPLINTEIKAKTISAAKKWFEENTIEHERVFKK